MPSLLRCTRSLSGSRTIRMAMSLCARFTIAPVSRPSRASRTASGSFEASGISAAVLSTIARREASKADRARIQQRVDIRPMRRQDIERQVDAVEIAIVLGAVLHMIDDLQRRTEWIGIG